MSEEEYTCPECQSTFGSEHGLKVHKGMSHSNEAETNEQQSQPQPAILTNAQRDYLKGKKDYRPSIAGDVDERIEERVAAAMSDFAILFNELEDEQLRKIFGSSFAQPITEIDELHNRGVDDFPAFGNSPFAFAFLARALNLENERVYPKLAELGERQIAFQHFIEQAELGIGTYLREYHRQDVSVSVSIDIESAEDYFPEHDESDPV